MSKHSFVVLLGAAVLFTHTAIAAVSTEEAKPLGTTLTSFGAVKAGNTDGSIPAYTGEGVKAPPGFNPKDGHRQSPYKDEKPLFTITAQTAAQYAERLTGGSTEMFKKYPSYRMNVYPTHRSMLYPKYLLDNSLKNATSCKAIDNGLRLEGCYAGVLFPIPKTGYEAMWNHLLAYETYRWHYFALSQLVPVSGKPVVMSGVDDFTELPIYDPKRTAPLTGNDVYWRVRYDTYAPTRAVGEKLILLDHVDPINVGRRVYQYIPGQRRVKLAPDLAYDTPTPVSAGSSTMDDAKTFAGALDRFDFKLLGKQEKYIPYNDFGVIDPITCPEEKMLSTKNFPNPECIRWELHRVWIVEANLKPQFRHIYKRRLFYWDEDAPQAGMADNYDASGKLYRVIQSAYFPYWDTEGGGGQGGLTFNMDMQTGAWSALGLLLGDRTGHFIANVKAQPESWFSPESLAGEGIR